MVVSHMKSSWRHSETIIFKQSWAGARSAGMFMCNNCFFFWRTAQKSPRNPHVQLKSPRAGSRSAIFCVFMSTVGFLGFPPCHILPFFFLKDVFFVEGILPLQILGRDAPQGVNEVKLDAWDWKNFTSLSATFEHGASLRCMLLVKFCFMMRSCCRAALCGRTAPHTISLSGDEVRNLRHSAVTKCKSWN